MEHKLPDLPFSLDALEPHISAETLEFHHGKHHAAYVKKLNGLLPESEFAELPLEDIVKRASGGIFNNAAQVWNHTFYWSGLQPGGADAPTGELAKAINSVFGSFGTFKEQFTDAATSLFGSGWTWLVRKGNGALTIESLSNAGNPMTRGSVPLLTCDVWEHAYYIDHRNARPKYVESFWNLVNWDVIGENFSKKR